MKPNTIQFNSDEFVQYIIKNKGCCPKTDKKVAVVGYCTTCPDCFTKRYVKQNGCPREEVLNAAQTHMNIKKNIKLVESL